MARFLILLLLLLGLLGTSGCNTTYVPITWGLGERVKTMSHSDPTLVTLFNHYDPEYNTLRMAGSSFEEVMMPEEVQYHLGAYRPDTKQIYRNLYRDYSDTELRDLLVHEFAHHIWFNFMTPQQQKAWRQHLIENPSAQQVMVRKTYPDPYMFDSEDFAFTVQNPRPIDIEELATLNLLTSEECDVILKQLAFKRSLKMHASAGAAERTGK